MPAVGVEEKPCGEIRLSVDILSEHLAHLRVKMADFLLEHNPDDFGSHMEAALLYCDAEAFDKAAEEIGYIIDWTLLPYSPEIADALLEKVVVAQSQERASDLL